MPEELTLSEATLVLTVQAPLPALIDRAPPVAVSVPAPEIDCVPATVRAIPPFAVMLFARFKAPEVEESVIDPAPRLIELEVAIEPAAETLRLVGVPAIVPRLRLVAPWIIVTGPVEFTLRTTTFVLSEIAWALPLSERAPAET